MRHSSDSGIGPPLLSSGRDACAVVAGLVFPTLVTFWYFVRAADDSATVQQTSYAIGKAIQFAFPLVWVVVVQRERLRLSTPRATGMLEGVGFGMVIVAAMLVLYHAYLKPAGYFDAAAEPIRRKVSGFGVDTLAAYAALGTFYAIGHSLLEEYYWRWFIFGQLQRLMPWQIAVVISSLGFMAHHILVLQAFFGWLSWPTVFFSLSVAVGGAVWAWLYHRSGSLYGVWVSHLLVDAGIFFIGYDVARDLF